MEVDKVHVKEEHKYGGIKAMPFIIGKWIPISSCTTHV